MVKGKKLEGYDEAVGTLQTKVVSNFQSVCKALVETLPTIEPCLIGQVVKSLIENSKIRMELIETGADFGMLRFIKTNVGEEAGIASIFQCY